MKNYKTLKKLLLFICVIVFSNTMMSQTIAEVQSIDLDDARDMFELLGINSFKYDFSEELKSKTFKIIIKEYSDGELVKEPIIFEFQNENENIETLKVLTEKITDTVEGVHFKIPNHIWTIKSLNLKYDRRDYKWVSLMSESSPIEFGKDTPFLTYTDSPKASNDPSINVFCVLPQLADQYVQWNKALSVRHFYIFFIRFE